MRSGIGESRFVLLASCVFFGACGDATGPVVARVELSPGTATLASLGDTVRLAAVAKDSRGSVVAGATFAWASSEQSIATVNAAGLVTAVRDGSARITAATAGVSGEATVTVAQAVATVDVWPAGTTLTALGDTVQLTAVGRDARGHSTIGVAYTWRSSDTTVVRVDGVGRAVAVANGAATVTAAAGTVAGAAPITVAQVVARVVVTPDTATLSPGDTVRLVAVLQDSRGNSVAGRSPSWASADTAVASVNQTGLVTAVGARLGPVTITGTSDGKMDTAAIDVVTTFASVAAGRGFSCALSTEGVPYCWGDGSLGQLGNGSTANGDRPAAVSGGMRFVALTAGGWHACGITGSGAAYCWGSLYATVSSRNLVPTAVGGGLGFALVSSGSNHVCGVTASGAGYCWGDNTIGALGDSTAVTRQDPTPVAGALVFRSVSAGSGRTCGVATDGVGYCWGLLSGQNSAYSRLTPLPVAGGQSWRSLDVSGGTACGIAADGVTYCWLTALSPEAVPGGRSFGSLTVGGEAWTVGGHLCAIDPAGAAYCWGSNESGQLGDGTTADRISPVAVTGGFVFRQIDAGISSHTCGVAGTGAAYCWGDNAHGQLGDGTPYRRLSPTLVMGSRR